ncbi:class I mannose-6-phosphate isomerase [Sphingosinicella terrae]|uniref:class I mannose-6-phosphate isomerase n=1 Tax=Sphingosinicella terrae TaxID=2172047 RepID=UPI000E0DF346|nr:class I mannose-6-phosphate isomerase [Sphingosinicella terrae]
MMAEPLPRRLVRKPWGRRDLPGWTGAEAQSEPVGEVWFPDPAGDEADLLVKYLFTSEKLSIQVHPDDRAARASGHRRGKDEAWLVLRADPGAAIGLGLREAVSRGALRAAALDGSIERLIDWRPVRAGDLFYSPAGTVHAIGAGLTVLEIQQNLDLTYRLYDYGRPRELHLDAGIAAADPSPWRAAGSTRAIAPGRDALASGAAFVVERWRDAAGIIGGDGLAPVWVIPLEAGASLDGRPLEPGSVWTMRGQAELAVPPSAELLLAYAGSEIRFAPEPRRSP